MSHDPDKRSTRQHRHSHHPGSRILARRMGLGGSGFRPGPARTPRHRGDLARTRLRGQHRAGIRLDDHISAIADAVAATPSSERVVLVAHSGAGPVAYAASDRVPDRLARIVYVDSGPLQTGTALREDLDASVTEIPLPSWSELEAEAAASTGSTTPRSRYFAAAQCPNRPARRGTGSNSSTAAVWTCRPR